MRLEFKTKDTLITIKAITILKQFEHVNMQEYGLGLSVIYNSLAVDFDRNAYLGMFVDRGFLSNKIFLFSQSKCFIMFPTFEPYNVKWSSYVQEHNRYMEQHLLDVIN